MKLTPGADAFRRRQRRRLTASAARAALLCVPLLAAAQQGPPPPPDGGPGPESDRRRERVRRLDRDGVRGSRPHDGLKHDARIQRLLERFDADGNGKLSIEEMQALRTFLAGQRLRDNAPDAPPAPSPPPGDGS